MKELDLGALHSSIAIQRNGEAQLRWARAQIFLVINSGALGIIPFISQSEPFKNYKYVGLLVLSIGAVLLSTLWVLATIRANNWIFYWNERLAAIEEFGEWPKEIRVFSSNEFSHHNWLVPSFHHTLVGLAGSFLLIWAALLFFAFAKVVTGNP